MIGSIRMAFLCVSFCLISTAARAQEIPSDYQDVLKSLDRKGDFKAGVLKVNIPRSDLKMTVQGVPTPTPFGFGGWIALTKASDGTDVMMGDLVLLQEEVNPVMSALLDNGIDVTALHNHFFWDEPHDEGEETSAVYKITVGRDDLSMKEHGAAINARMGRNTWAAFTGTQEGCGRCGDA